MAKDKICKCGHKKSEHLQSDLDDKRLHCPYEDCNCDEFKLTKRGQRVK